MDAFKWEFYLFLGLQRGDGIHNLRKEGQNEGFHFLFLEPMHHIKIIHDFFHSNSILVCDKLGINTLQKDLFNQKRVPVVNVIMEL